MNTPFLINHLWQSSCFALLAGLLAFVLRQHSPKVRYWVWLSASLKFLMPFALLMSLGSVVPRPPRHPVSVPAPVFPNTLVQIAEPFSADLDATVPAQTPLDWMPAAIGVVWALGFLAITRARCRSWLGVRAAVRGGRPIELPIPVRALITPGAEEPGIVGFLRPVLVLPDQLLEQMNPRQLGAILAHELCHVRRRDNLFAAVHMVVEAIFWFHPLVWWIGSRMVEERELACDEEVLRTGCEPADYVEGILKVCRFYLESPLPCISGVTGADVKKRLHAILAGSIARELCGAKKMALAAIGLAALAAPVLIGVLNAPTIRAQNAMDWQVKAGGRMSFDVASLKPSQIWRSPPFSLGPDDAKSSGGRLSATFSLGTFIEFAYKLARFQTADAFASAPEWLRTNRYEIDAKAQGNPTKDQMRLMMQSLLADRLKLVVHFETKELPVLALTQVKAGKLGPKLLPHSQGPPCPEYKSLEFGTPPPNARKDVFPPNCAGGVSRGMPDGTWFVGSRDTTMAIAVQTFYSYGSMAGEIDRPVVDQTGLKGTFDFVLEYGPANNNGFPAPVSQAPNASPGAAAASNEFGGTPFVEALRKQLGLKLVRTKAPVRVLVIDHVEKPSGN